MSYVINTMLRIRLMESRPRVIEARLSPRGFVAQRLEESINGKGRWVETFVIDGSSLLNLEVFNDDEVADWPRLVVGE
jgi:hypothetical protein